MPYRLLALDVDGTLLDSAGALRARVRQAVRAVAEAGCTVALATGRRFAAAAEVAAALGLDTPLILHNGALVRRAQSGAVLAQAPIPLPVARGVAATIVAAGLQPIVFPPPSVGEGVIAGPTERDSELATLYLEGCFVPVERRPLDDLFTDVPPLTLVVMDAEARLDTLLPRLSDRDDVHVTRNTFPLLGRPFHVLDILAAGCSKAAALATLAAWLGVSLSETVAIGDHWNDVEMLETAGLGIAMGSAPPAVQARANRVTRTSDEDGVAEALAGLEFGG